MRRRCDECLSSMRHRNSDPKRFHLISFSRAAGFATAVLHRIEAW
jgi:hypothetical protein